MPGFRNLPVHNCIATQRVTNMSIIVKLENTNVICDVVKSPKKSSVTMKFSPEDHVIAEIKKRLLEKYPGSKCQKWACYERTIKSTAAPGAVIKAVIQRIAVIFPEPNKDGRRYEAHALLPDILLPNLQYSVPNLAVLIYSGEITRSADDEIVCSAEDKADDDDETGLGDKYEVFLTCICWLLAASEEMIEKGINRFSERPDNTEDARQADRNIRRMTSDKYKIMVLSNLARNINGYLPYIPKPEADEASDCPVIPENTSGMEAVGLPEPEEREKNGYFASGMFNPDKHLMTESALRMPLTESLDSGTAGKGIPVSAADSEITGGAGACSADYSLKMMEARQKNKGKPKYVSESPEPQTRGIFRFLCDSLFLIGTYPGQLLKCLMPATGSGKCFYSPGTFLRWLAEAAQAAENAAAGIVPS